MPKLSMIVLLGASLISMASGYAVAWTPHHDDLRNIQTVVVIYAENRSFDSLLGAYPGANGLSRATRAQYTQLDRDGSVLPGLPAVWGGTNGNSGPVIANARITSGAPPAPNPVTEMQTAAYLNTFNHPYSILSLYDTVSTIDTDPLTYTNRDLYHRFYENQMQINGGANNMFAAWADSGGLTMMYMPNKTADHPLWTLAQKNVLADNFFQSAFGGSYLNHQFLICSCAPIYPGNGTVPVNPAPGATSANAPVPSVVNADGVTLTTSSKSPASALNGPPAFVNSSVITPAIGGVFYSINTSQPPFPPSSNAIASTPPQQSVNLLATNTLPPQTQTTIGDLLTAAGVNWAYYAGAWNYALSNPPNTPGTSAANPNFQYHHQPFNYFEAFDPGTTAGAANRAAHLLDAGVSMPENIAAGTLPPSRFLTDIQNGNLPPVTFYKLHGPVNEHNGPRQRSVQEAIGTRRPSASIKSLPSSLANGPFWESGRMSKTASDGRHNFTPRDVITIGRLIRMG
jgi:acid phosphatase